MHEINPSLRAESGNPVYYPLVLYDYMHTPPCIRKRETRLHIFVGPLTCPFLMTRRSRRICVSLTDSWWRFYSNLSDRCCEYVLRYNLPIQRLLIDSNSVARSHNLTTKSILSHEWGVFTSSCVTFQVSERNTSVNLM